MLQLADARQSICLENGKSRYILILKERTKPQRGLSCKITIL